MASYFVSKLGSNANNGTTWALAKLTIQAGLSLCTVAGDILYVAPGRYNEQSVFPPSAGTRAAKKSWIGDWMSNTADSGGNFSGVAPGFIYCDATKQTGTKGFSTTVSFTAVSKNEWAYWNVKNLYFTGGFYGFIVYALTGGTAHDGVTYENLVSESWGNEKSIQVGNWNIDSDAGASITLNNCISVTRMANTVYSSGFYADNATTTLRTNPCWARKVHWVSLYFRE